MTKERFALGIGSGGLHRADFRAAMGISTPSMLAIMRDYLSVIRGLLAGEPVDHDGPAITARRLRLDINPAPRTPVYLGALGPRMLELAGEAADGVCLNWCTTEQVAAARNRVDAAAQQAGRAAGSVPLVEYIRICVDEDAAAARLGLAHATIGYAMGPAGADRERRSGYRAHFERMGFTEELAELDQRRAGGASTEELGDAVPDRLLLAVGYYDTPSGASEHFATLATGLDDAIVRVVAARPGLEAPRAVIRACAPITSAYAAGR